MKRILIFSGTTEGRQLADILDASGICADVCVATGYGHEVMTEGQYRNIYTGRLTEEEMKEKVTIDMEMPFLCVTEELVKELELLEPFGKGNTKPIFAARGVTLLGARILGKNRNVLKIKAQDANGSVIEAMLFQNVEGFLKNMEETYGRMEVDALLQGRGGHIKIAVTYYPDINEYMGKRTPQIVITHYR